MNKLTLQLRTFVIEKYYKYDTTQRIHEEWIIKYGDGINPLYTATIYHL